MKTGTLQVQRDNEIVPTYVWETPIRLAHWLIVLALVLLCGTGICLHDFSGTAEINGIGRIRATHALSGLLLVAALLLRFYWFWAGNEWARLPAFLPLTRDKWRNIQAMLRYYIIGGRPPMAAVGHNSLAACAYLALYALLAIQCLTGGALLSVAADNALLSAITGWIPRILGPGYVRVTHHWLMFVFMAFALAHICAIVLFARQTKNGLLTSMVTGRKLIPRELPK